MYEEELENCEQDAEDARQRELGQDYGSLVLVCTIAVILVYGIVINIF